MSSFEYKWRSHDWGWYGMTVTISQLQNHSLLLLVSVYNDPWCKKSKAFIYNYNCIRYYVPTGIKLDLNLIVFLIPVKQICIKIINFHTTVLLEIYIPLQPHTWLSIKTNATWLLIRPSQKWTGGFTYQFHGEMRRWCSRCADFQSQKPCCLCSDWSERRWHACFSTFRSPSHATEADYQQSAARAGQRRTELSTKATQFLFVLSVTAWPSLPAGVRHSSP